jgi:hypothetical protein
MSLCKLIVVSFVCAAYGCASLRAQDASVPKELPVLETRTSWIGNSFSGADSWVQNYADEIEVAADGSVYTASTWDEAGRCTGVYKDGRVNQALFKQFDGKGGHKAWGWGTASNAVAIDDDTLYLVNTEGELLRFDRVGAKYRDTTKLFEITNKDGERKGGAVGLTYANGLLLIVRDNGEITCAATTTWRQCAPFWSRARKMWLSHPTSRCGF